MCFPVCLFWNFVIHFSRSSPSLQCFFILWLRFYFVHPPTPVFLHPSILSLVSFLCFSILGLLCLFFHPSSGSSVISSILQLLCFFIHPLAPCLSSFSSRSLAALARLFCDRLVQRSCGCCWFLVVSNGLPVSCEL